MSRLVAGLALAVLAGCSPAASPSVAMPKPSGKASPAVVSFTATDVLRSIEGLANLGIETRVRPSDADPIAPINGDRSLVRLLRTQVRNLALEVVAGGGTRGADLDALSVAAGGGMVSPLVAGWATSAPTAAAAWAGSLLDREQAADPSAAVFPTLALVAFVADASSGSGQAMDGPPAVTLGLAGSAGGRDGVPALLTVVSSSDFCAEVSAYLSAALSDIVDADADPPQWLRELIDVYAPQYAGDPDLLRRTIGAIALLSYATSLARPWNVNVAPDPQAIAYGVEGQDPVAGEVDLSVLSGKDVFATDVAECASLADAQLASIPVEGSSVVWDTIGLGAHATDIAGQAQVDENGVAALTYETATESKDTADNGDPLTAQVWVNAWVDRAEMAALAAVVKAILLGDASGTAAGPTVKAIYQALEPTLNTVMRPSGYALIDVTYHQPNASPSPSQAESQLTGTWVGTWAIDPPYAAVVGDFTMQLVQTGRSFNGTVEPTNTDCSNGTVDGTVAGTSVTFGWVLTRQPIQFSGVLSGTSMSGTWASVACSDPTISLTGTWQATKKP